MSRDGLQPRLVDAPSSCNPPTCLREAGTLESTIRHELLHMLIDSYALPGTPLWFREGLVLYLTAPNASPRPSDDFADLKSLEKALRAPASEEELRHAYAGARARVAATCAAAWQGSINRLGAEWTTSGANRQRVWPTLRSPVNSEALRYSE